MNLGFPVQEITEGKAKILVPELDVDSGAPIQQLRSKAPVFYNPVMEVNRDTAVLALAALQKDTGRPVSICDPMCGSGVRGIRFLLELKQVSSLVMGDLNPTALSLASTNAKLNKLSDRVRLRLLDVNLLLSLNSYPGGRFDYVDIDPYGSPSPFINNGILSLNNRGLIALTATDMAPLCGVNPKACIRKYMGASIRSEFSHEVAIRLLAGYLVRQAAVHEVSATPKFSYYSDHYIRLYARLVRGAKRADKKIEEIGYLKYCPSCLQRETSLDNKREKCPVCDGFFEVAGPLWLGELAEKRFVKAMLRDLSSRDYLFNPKTEDIIKKVKSEVGFPVGFFNIDKICSLAGTKSIPTEDAIERVRNNGYSITLTHFDNRGFKSDANIIELKRIFT